MDVNGSRFHLIFGGDDWLACPQTDQPDGFVGVQFDQHRNALTLRPVLSLFRPDRPSRHLTPADRRGAGTDRFGNVYWIGADSHTLYWSPPRGRPRVFWEQALAACPPTADQFHDSQAPSPPDNLAGLAVTEHHYLIVGDVSQRGLLVFDLHAGGPPVQLRWPDGIDFVPFDLAPAPGGGVWVLDRLHAAYWGLDRYLRVVSDSASVESISEIEASTFRPLDGTVVIAPRRSFGRGFALDAADPVSIEGLADGSVLILDVTGSPSNVGSSIQRYARNARIGDPLPLEDDLLVEVGSHPLVQRLGVVGHDFVFIAGGGAAGPADGTLYVADDDGKQVVAFRLHHTAVGASLEACVEYLPLHAYAGRALVGGPAEGKIAVFYDLAPGGSASDQATRWVQLQAVDQPRYVVTAELLLGQRNSMADDPPHFDGQEHDCTWHRLFIDACIPPEASVEVWSRAANTLADLPSLPFQHEPTPYLRGAGAEIPFYRPFADEQDELDSSTRNERGTWETLFQSARGRYLQVRLVLRGNGRMSPAIRAVRIYYPRFSYVKRYLPGVYQQESQSADFAERLLANMEGFNTDTEGRIGESRQLFDARTTPPEALDWLAGWLGLVLDPLWARIQSRRAAVASVAAAGCVAGAAVARSAFAPAPDRRRLFIRFARKLYERRGTPTGIQFALHLLLDPCLEETLDALKQAATLLNPVLRDELKRIQVEYPASSTTDEDLEDVLYALVLTPRRPSKVRLIEHFQTRDGRALVVGDVTSEGRVRSSAVDANAHRFTVLVPERLLPEEAAMVERIVGLEKPAHTSFAVHRYYDYFRVGEARLGTDSVLGEEARFVAMILDQHYLAQGYVAPAPPMDTAERLIADRDRPAERAL